MDEVFGGATFKEETTTVRPDESERRPNRHQRRRAESSAVQTKAKKDISELFREFTSKVEKLMGEVVTKHNDLAKQVMHIEETQQKIAKFAAQEFGKLAGEQQLMFHQLMTGFDHLDTNVVSTGKILKEIFGQLIRIDTIMDQGNLTLDETRNSIESIKVKAQEYFSEILTEATEKTLEMKKKKQEEEQAAFEAEIAAKKIEEEKAAKDRLEAEAAEKELRSSDDRSKLATPVAGGQGAAIPEGADVFGG